MEAFKELIGTWNGGQLTSILLNYMEEAQIRQLLIEHLSDEDKRSVIYNYVHEGWNIKKPVTIIRGTPAFVFSRDYIKRGIVTPQHIYNISKVYTKTYLLGKKNRVLGVVIGKVFHICYHIKLQSGVEVFGYFVSNCGDSYQVQTIIDFVKFSYDAYNNSYALGEVLEMHESEISTALYDWRERFYTEFI